MADIEFIVADITRMNIEAIVFPAHKHLIRGRGLSGQIYDLVGEQLVEFCQQLDKCPIGEARITPGFSLPAKYLIHTVTPLWSGGDQWGSIVLQQLRQCYENSIKVALENDIKDLAFASLGSGHNKIPHDLSSRVGMDVLLKYKKNFQRLVICSNSITSNNNWLKAQQNAHQTHAINMES